MTWIVLETLPNGKVLQVCDVCGKQTAPMTPGKPVYHNCRPPTLLKKAKKYFQEFRTWMLAGFPKRTWAEVARLYDTFCSTCSARVVKGKKETCRECGCDFGKKGTLRNKLRWETSHCPRKNF